MRVRHFLDKIILKFPWHIQDWLAAHIYTFSEKRKIKIETPAFYVFDDNSIINKIAFIDVCEKNGTFWPDEVEKIRKEYDI